MSTEKHRRHAGRMEWVMSRRLIPLNEYATRVVLLALPGGKSPAQALIWVDAPADLALSVPTG